MLAHVSRSAKKENRHGLEESVEESSCKTQLAKDMDLPLSA
jgi:hypothetical protein